MAADNAPYTNGEMGVCEITGTISPVITPTWNLCGGTISVVYPDATDDCNRTITGGSFVINVDAAPEATVTAPTFATSISCAMAQTFTAADATYTNGLTGNCEISGNITANITTNFNSCGGTITISYDDVDNCNNILTAGPFTINVDAAPEATIQLPVLPSSISCSEAGTYNPPTTTFTNGLTGVCNSSGNAISAANNFYDECGGYLQLVYLATDECGRDLIPLVVNVSVEAAPAPTLSVPSLPTTLTCSESSNYFAPPAFYDNGLLGTCNISGALPGQIVRAVDACDGGTITVTYAGQDNCGNLLSADPIVITVLPAPAAQIIAPDIEEVVFCFQVDDIVSIPAQFSNGETGTCANAGMIQPLVEPFFNDCEGGLVLITYTGFDNCGNPLAYEKVITVLPDTQAPYGDSIGLEITLDFNAETPHPDSTEMIFYKDSIASYFYDDCSAVVVTVVGDTGTPQCGNDGTFIRTYFMEIADECGNVADTSTLTLTGQCNPLFCTLSQDYFAGEVSNDSLYGMSSFELLDSLMGFGEDSILIGQGECGFILDDADCVRELLQSHGQSISLPNDFSFNCNPDFGNALVNQIVTTTLNIRYNQLMNPNDSLDLGNFLLETACVRMPGYIESALPDSAATVNDVIEYANNFLACQCNDDCEDFKNIGADEGYEYVMADLTSWFLGLNSRFENCNIPSAPCDLEEEEVQVNNVFQDSPFLPLTPLNGESQLDEFGTLNLYPNPTNRFINLESNDLLDRNATIQIFNNLGKLVAEKSFTDIQQTQLQMNVSQLTSGMYLITIETADEGKRFQPQRFQILK